MVMLENIIALRKYTLKELRVKIYNYCNLKEKKNCVCVCTCMCERVEAFKYKMHFVDQLFTYFSKYANDIVEGQTAQIYFITKLTSI